MSTLDILLFQVYPYVALAVFLLGSWARYDLGAYMWRTGSSQLLSGRGMRLGSNWFHLGVIAILCGHFVGLLTPHWVYERFLGAGTKQLLAMAIGGSFGVMCLAGMTILLWRRLFDARIRATGSRRDLLVLLLLYAQLLLGLASIIVSSDHMDGMQMMKLDEWAQRIVTFRGDAAAHIADAHWIYKTHVLLGLTLLLVFPFSRLVHVWSIPLGYLSRPYQRVRRRQPASRNVR